jgi:hypothetical protein
MFERDTDEANIPEPIVRKAWRTPQVIVSTVAGSEAKGPPSAELSLVASPTTNTPNS